jgi:hypothetical protein
MILKHEWLLTGKYIDVIEPWKRTVSVEYFRYILSKIKNDCGF